MNLNEKRYEVIAIFPNSELKVGDILYSQQFQNNVWFEKERYSSHAIHEMDIDKYPHLFKELAWYEKRDEKDLPKYVRDIEIENLFYKVTAWLQNNYSFKNEDGSECPTNDFTPVTIEQYEQFKKNEQ